MLFYKTFFLSILFISLHTVSAVNVEPFLTARQTQCDSICNEAQSLMDSVNCAIPCFCEQSTMNAVSQCLQCGEPTGFSDGAIQGFINDCADLGYPVTLSGSTPSGTGLGSGGATASHATAAPTSSGITSGKSSATDLTARLGAVAAVAAVGVVILAA